MAGLCEILPQERACAQHGFRFTFRRKTNRKASFNFEKRNMKWKKVKNYLANHYPKIEGTRQTRTGIVFKPDPHIIHIPKNVQLEQGALPDDTI